MPVSFFKRSERSRPNDFAASLHQHDVAPVAAQTADTFTNPDDTKSVSLMQGNADGILPKDPCLERPYPGGFGCLDQRREQRAPDMLPARRSCNIHADLGNATICLTA